MHPADRVPAKTCDPPGLESPLVGVPPQRGRGTPWHSPAARRTARALPHCTSVPPDERTPMDPIDGGLLRILNADLVVLDTKWRFALRNPFWRIYCNDGPGASVVHPEGVLELQAGMIHVLPSWGAFTSHCTRSVTHA